MLATILKCLFAPILLGQGRAVRRNTPRLPEPEGPRRGGHGGFRLLVLGDSSGAGVGVETFEQTLAGRLIEGLGGENEVTWTVTAKTGWTTADALLASADLKGPFDMAVTALGVNDVTAGLSRSEAASLHTRLLEELTGRLGAKHVVVSTVPPMGRFPALPWPLRWYLGRKAAEYDAAIESLASCYPNVVRLKPSLSMDPANMASDGFHPGDPVYREWAERILALEFVRNR